MLTHRHPPEQSTFLGEVGRNTPLMSWSEPKGAQSPPLFTPREEEREWLSRTAKEIAKINSDVHGVTEGLETLGLTASAKQNEATLLSKLEDELSEIPGHRKGVLIEAQRKCPKLVDDAAKLSFLRTEEFNAKSAAERLAAYWEKKKKLFGAEKCFLPVTLRGALKDDAIALTQGLIRILPVKDKRGREIIFIDPAYYKPGTCSTESMLRACWYVLSVAAEDPELEVVLLSSGKNFRCLQHFNYELYKGIVEMERCYLPIRWRSCHHCYPSIFFHLTSPITKYFLGGRLRARFICHFGTEDEVLKKLDSFGFPRENVPVELGGSLILDQRKWLLSRLQLEEQVHGLPLLARDGDVSKESAILRKGVQVPVTAISAAEISPMKESRRPSSGEDDSSENDLDSSKEILSSRGTKFNKGDPRMNAALDAKLKNPQMSLLDALLEGGFEFSNVSESGLSAKKIFDSQNVSLYQRKNQLNRRIRKERKRQRIDAPEKMAEVSEEAGNGALLQPATDHVSMESSNAYGQPAISSGDLVMSGVDNSSAQDFPGSAQVANESTIMDVSDASPSPSANIGDEPVRRDSFYDMITELPGLGDLEGAIE